MFGVYAAYDTHHGAIDRCSSLSSPFRETASSRELVHLSCRRSDARVPGIGSVHSDFRDAIGGGAAGVVQGRLIFCVR